MATTQQYLEELITQKNNLVSNLVSKGVSVSESDTLNTLVSKVLEIPSGGGDISEYISDFDSRTSSGGLIVRLVKKIPSTLTLNTSITNGSNMFNDCVSLEEIPQIDISHIVNASSMFGNCSSLTTIPLLDTGNVTNMFNMFNNCKSLTTIPLLDTSSVTSMQQMFNNCSSLTTIPLLDTSNVVYMRQMFGNCSSLTTIPELDTSNATDMQQMFSGCSSLTTIPLIDTSKITNMFNMFGNCKSLTTIPLIDTSNVTNMQQMFGGCNSLTTIPELDTSNVTNMGLMFASQNNMKNNLQNIPELDAHKIYSIADIFLSNDSTGYPDFEIFGGLKDLGKGYTQKSTNYNSYKLELKYCPNLSHDSLMNVINKLYDLNLTYDVANGGTLYTQRLTLDSINLAKLTAEEIAIATNKGWTVS